MIPQVRVIRVRFKPCSDTINRVSYYDCEQKKVHYSEHQGDALNLSHAIGYLVGAGLHVTGQFEYKNDTFLIVSTEK